MGMRKWIVLAALLGMAAAPPVQAEDASSGVSRLGPQTRLLAGRFVSGDQPDGNTVIIRSGDGAIVFDAGRHPGHVQRIIDLLQADGVSEVALLNSHWHLDHSGGLAALRAAFPGSELHASEAIVTARQGFLANYRQQLAALQASPPQNGPSPAFIAAELALIDGSAAMLPEHPLRTSESRTLFGSELYLGLGRGVSGGDLWVLDGTANMLLAGDLVTLPAPLLDTACAERWAGDLDILAAQEFDTLVPGHGRALGRREFRRWHRGFDALRQCAASERPRAECRDDWLDVVKPLINRDDRKLGQELLDYYLDQVLTEAGQAARCAG